MNILLLSSIYPIPGPKNQGTKVCHYFAQEWMKMGHNVNVIHFQAVYPRVLYWCAKLMRDYIVSKTGAVIYSQRDNEIVSYDMDGIKVTRIPVFKPIPHGKFSAKSINKSVSDIIELNRISSFVPDVILGHFVNPQLQVLNDLKVEYPNAIISLVFHGYDEFITLKNVYKHCNMTLLNRLNIVGFRNLSLKQYYEKKFNCDVKKFICYSGIPRDYIAEENNRKFNGNLTKFIYVGELIERKYPVVLIDALQRVYPKGNYHITYVGEGYQENVIRERVKLLELSKNVSLLGKVPRSEIKSMYDKAQCMIMVSVGEAYGLVYLEAMARGCITIASKREGFDGIIKHGVNGFLCKSGDADELASVINHINSLTPAEKYQISNKAIETAKLLTDYNAAKMYLEDVLNSKK